jgi:hypothetical protein
METPQFDLNDVITGLGAEIETPSEEPTEAPAEPAPQPEPTEEPVEEPDQQQALLNRIEQLTEERLRSEDTPITDPTQVEPQSVEHNYLEGLDIDEVLGHSDNLNKLLLAVHNKVLSDASRITAENIMRSLPRVISQYVSNHMTMAEMVREFYEANPDLKAVKRTVAAVANEIAGNEPGLPTAELFKKAGEKTREVLKLKKITPSPQRMTPRTNPAFARQKGRAIVPELTGIEKEIDELIMR